MGTHITVLKTQTTNALKVKNGGIYVDATLGNGGHSMELLSTNVPLTLLAFDLDNSAISNFERLLEESGFAKQGNEWSKAGQKVVLANTSFAKLEAELGKFGINQIDGLIADLGWSTDQLETMPGLAYSKDSALDMRFDNSLGVTAADLLNALGPSELEKLFQRYSDLGYKLTKSLSQHIVNQRKVSAFATTTQLVEVITALTSDQRDVAQVFQALRIAVNGELDNLKQILVQGFKLLTAGGAIAVITFHSKEEEVVQQFIAEQKVKLEELIRPDVSELRDNLRSRSAKLWIIRK